MYTVINTFSDKQDANRLYRPGDIYPAEGVKVTKGRLHELSHRHPMTGKVYIKEIIETPPGGESEGGADGGQGEGLLLSGEGGPAGE